MSLDNETRAPKRNVHLRWRSRIAVLESVFIINIEGTFYVVRYSCTWTGVWIFKHSSFIEWRSLCCLRLHHLRYLFRPSLHSPRFRRLAVCDERTREGRKQESDHSLEEDWLKGLSKLSSSLKAWIVFTASFLINFSSRAFNDFPLWFAGKITDRQLIFSQKGNSWTIQTKKKRQARSC